ncbi:MAG: hypothetical protein ACK4WH_12715 [Phycisphaerales bacterium]
MTDRWSTIRAGLLALFVASLIWIWAEGESLVSRPMPRVQVQLPRDLGGEFVLQPEDQSWNGIVQVRLEGPVRAIESAVPLLGPGVQLLMPENVAEAKDGRISINLREALARIPELAPFRGIIAEVQPKELNVRALRMINRELPIRVQLARELAIDGEPVASPATVTVRMPAGASSIMGDGARVLATVSEDMLLRLRNDGPQTFSVPLRLPADSSVDPALVVIRPDTASVSLRPRQALDTARLPSVPVWFSLPPTEDGTKWSVEVLDKFLTDVSVTGPTVEVARIKDGAVAIKAIVELATEDLERALADPAGITKPAGFIGAPAGVTCSVANGTVRVRVSRREP